jgi:hypothetical protein
VLASSPDRAFYFGCLRFQLRYSTAVKQSDETLKNQGRLIAMAELTEFEPIFVHASARSGSTFFFNVLRRDPSLLCFNEAIIDGKLDYARFRGQRVHSFDKVDGPQKWDVNHHFLDRPDYAEFIEAWDEVMHLCPAFPTFQDYLPLNGLMSTDLVAYFAALMRYARSRGQRPVLCETNSRGRAGALRSAFGGYHIAQYRDPLSQFGSLLRALLEAGSWGFLAHPAVELGVGAEHPLYQLVPEKWRAPHFPWLADTRAHRWASDARYMTVVASPDPNNVVRVFGWHLFAWMLNNLAAVSYSDLALDIDRAHDDETYRDFVVEGLMEVTGAPPDFGGIRKFDRYYEFDFFDIAAVCREVEAAIQATLADGRLEAALRMLGIQPPVVSAKVASELLMQKLRNSLAAMQRSCARKSISAMEWKAIVGKNRKIWFNPGIQFLAARFYLLVAPVVRMARRAGVDI